MDLSALIVQLLFGPIGALVVLGLAGPQIKPVVAGLIGLLGGLLAGQFLPIVAGFAPGSILGSAVIGLLGGATLGSPVALVLLWRRYSAGQGEASGQLPLVSRAVRDNPALSEKIFISYRRDDSLDVTGRLYDRLSREYGDSAVLRDMDSIKLGRDFRQEIDKHLADCTVCIVMIGSKWLTVTDASGQRRLDDPRDHVRIEIETAMRRNIPVVPLLVGGARIPAVEDLPDSLKDLAFRNGIPLRPDPDFHRDVDRLIAGLRSN